MHAHRFRWFACIGLLALETAYAQHPFTGEWEIDLRTPAQKSAGAECGKANFELDQAGDRVTGDHSMATVGCGRLNDGGEGTVEGAARGTTAILLVTSGRNGEVVRGRAVREGSSLHWQVLEQIRPGAPDGDSGLILGSGLLRSVKR
jgi:hypothetical protein